MTVGQLGIAMTTTVRRSVGAAPGALHVHGGRRVPIATKLIFSFLAVILLISLPFILVGVRLIDHRVVVEAQEKVRNDLNTAREIQAYELGRINDVVRLTADRFFLREALLGGSIEEVSDELIAVRDAEGLDVLTVTDADGVVLLRTSNRVAFGDSQRDDEIVSAVLADPGPYAAYTIVDAADLRRESAALALQARFEFVDTPKARAREETAETAGMMLKAAAPVFDEAGKLIGIVYGGVLENRNFDTVDKIKQTVYQDTKYNGKDIGTATVFQDDVRISTNVRNLDGSRAIGTRVTEEVYNRVVREGARWVDRAYVVNNWYITAYEPIRNLKGEIIGILYVGLLEEKYNDIRAVTILTFLGITLMGTVAAMALAYVISRRMSRSLQQLVVASSEVASGNLDAKVEIYSNDELHDLADAFNAMASALKARDQQLKEMARSRVRKSERLAMVGQLAAGVAHELNNPMQGIVSYSLLLLEDMPEGDDRRDLVNRIVRQANRCTEIVRELLDFSRQKTPHRSAFDVNMVLDECVSLVERQEMFHNIEIVRDLEPGLPEVIMDPSQIQQVFMNLIINAAEAMDGTGRLILRTKLGPQSQCVEISVADTGVGITPEHMGKVFVPFFTTKEAGQGVGLGLAISYKIIQEHKGQMGVESEPGKGTTFTIRLPASGDGGCVEDG